MQNAIVRPVFRPKEKFNDLLAGISEQERIGKIATIKKEKTEKWSRNDYYPSTVWEFIRLEDQIVIKLQWTDLPWETTEFVNGKEVREVVPGKTKVMLEVFKRNRSEEEFQPQTDLHAALRA